MLFYTINSKKYCFYKNKRRNEGFVPKVNKTTWLGNRCIKMAATGWNLATWRAADRARRLFTSSFQLPDSDEELTSSGEESDLDSELLNAEPEWSEGESELANDMNDDGQHGSAASHTNRATQYGSLGFL